MNIKRAFFAAIAVLAMPGLAMAQSTNTFDTSITISGGTGEVDVTLNCNSGFPNVQTGTTPFIFSVAEVATGATCSIVATSLPSGASDVMYVADGGTPSATGCEYMIENGQNVFHTCAISATITASDFNVTVDWVTTDPDVDLMTIGQNAEVVARCQNVYTMDGLTTVTYPAVPATPQSIYPISFDAQPDPAGTTVCDATLINTESSVEVNATACGSVSLVAGTPGDCTITATVFFEGIPTLSQYGMAIMALLMLGVGFVGFRRFV